MVSSYHRGCVFLSTYYSYFQGSSLTNTLKLTSLFFAHAEICQINTFNGTSVPQNTRAAVTTANESWMPMPMPILSYLCLMSILGKDSNAKLHQGSTWGRSSQIAIAMTLDDSDVERYDTTSML
jgi:hypothetical protein